MAISERFVVLRDEAVSDVAGGSRRSRCCRRRRGMSEVMGVGPKLRLHFGAWWYFLELLKGDSLMTEHRRGNIRRTLSAVVLGLTLIPALAAGSLKYVVTDLGTLGGRTSTAKGINNLGQVVGYSSYDSNGGSFAGYQGFIWDGTMKAVGMAAIPAGAVTG